MGVLLVKVYHIVPYSQEDFTKALIQDCLIATTPGARQPWGQALFQGLMPDNPFLPDFIAKLHANAPTAIVCVLSPVLTAE